MLRYTLITAALCYAGCYAGYAQAYDFRRLADEHIVPRYQALTTDSRALEQALHSACQTPSDSTLHSTQAAYRRAFGRWQAVQHIRFGPIQYLAREHRYQLWPDKRNSVSKHLSQLLAEPQLLTSELDISQKSVAVQGFSALEQLLFQRETLDAYSCRVAGAITANLSAMSANLLSNWTTGDAAYSNYFHLPTGDDDNIYETDSELASEILNSLYTQLERMTTQKLDLPLGDSSAKARGRRAEGWRSETSRSALAHNLEAVQAIYNLTYAPVLNHSQDNSQGVSKESALATNIENAFSRARAALELITMPLSQAVSDPEQRQHLLQLRQALSQLKQLIAQDLAQSLNLSLGFNSLDGD